MSPHSSLSLRFAFLLALLACAPPAFAASDVLLPDSTSSGGGFNLGLTPHSAAPASDTTKSTTDDSASAPAPTTTLPNLNNDTLPSTPVPAAPATGATATGSVDPNGVAGNGLHFPTQIIDQPVAPDLTKIPGMKLPPNRLSIDLSSKSVWGQGDLATISDKLGIPPGQVASLCRLSLNGLVQSDGTAAIVDTQGAPHANVYYSGHMQGATLAAQALCSISQPPPNAGWVIRSNGKFIVMLGGVNCPATVAGRNPSGIVVVFTGNGASSCSYQ